MTNSVLFTILESTSVSAIPMTGGASMITKSKTSLATDSSEAKCGPCNNSTGLGGSGPEVIP